MDHLETPYDLEVEFIECKICEKSIRGETLYKIHLTTPGHLKKEDALLAQGALVGHPAIPKFRDISHYLDYLNLDEPIIGLSFLKEIPPDDLQAGPKYLCNLCTMTSHLPEMVHHLVGRKHRQKYVQTVRPDLVTWDTQSIVTQGGRIIRAKAEIIERQDGRGTPVPLAKMGNRGNINNSRGPQRQTQNWNSTTEQISQGQVAPRQLDLKNYQNKFSNQRNYPSDLQNKPGFQPEDLNVKQGRRHQWDDPFSHNRMEDQPQRGPMYRENFIQNIGPDHHTLCDFGGGPPGRAPFEPGDRAPMQDFREKMSCGQAQQGAYFPENVTPYERSYPVRGAPNEFYSDQHGRGQIPPMNYNPEEEKQHWSREQKPSGADNMYRADRQDFCEPEAKRSTFSQFVNSEQAGDFFNPVRDFHNEKRPPHREDYPDPDRAGAPTSQRQVTVSRAISDIPEPFKRYLTGATNESQGKRKRKSRFTDATPEELEMAKEMFDDDQRHPSPQFSGDAGPPSRRESSGMQFSDHYRELENPQHPEDYQRGGSISDGVFDVLKNIEIENAEQADFLKNKLCGLLKEFKWKKMEQETQNSQNRPGTFRNYSNSKPEPQLPRQSSYERSPRQDTDHRELFRDRREQRPEQQHQEYPRPLHAEPRHTGRSCYEGMFETAHGSHLDEPPYYPERFQEPLRSHDYQPAVKEFYDSPLPMEHGSRMNRGPRYSNSLDKIASTLLELVSKK